MPWKLTGVLQPGGASHSNGNDRDAGQETAESRRALPHVCATRAHIPRYRPHAEARAALERPTRSQPYRGSFPLGTPSSGQGQSLEFLTDGRRLGESDWISLQTLRPQMTATAPDRVPRMKTPAPSTAGSIGPRRTSNCGPLTFATSQAADVATTIAAIPTTAVIHTRCAKAAHLERRSGCGPMDDIIALRRLRSETQSPDNPGHGRGKSNQHGSAWRRTNRVERHPPSAQQPCPATARRDAAAKSDRASSQAVQTRPRTRSIR